jgi:hypothetical protein
MLLGYNPRFILSPRIRGFRISDVVIDVPERRIQLLNARGLSVFDGDGVDRELLDEGECAGEGGVDGGFVGGELGRGWRRWSGHVSWK